MREPGAASQQGEYQRWQLWEKYPEALLCPSGRRFCFGCCRPGWWDFSVPLHLPFVTLWNKYVSPVTDALGICLGSKAAAPSWPSLPHHLCTDAHFCASVPSLLQLHSPYVQTWIPKLLSRERRVHVLIVIVYI